MFPLFCCLLLAYFVYSFSHVLVLYFLLAAWRYDVGVLFCVCLLFVVFFCIRPCVISFVFVVCMCRALSFSFSKSSRCRRRRLVFLYDLLLIASRACVLYIFFCGGRGVVWAMLFFVGCVFTPLFSFLMIRSLRHGWWFCLLCVQISWCAPCWFVFLFVLCFGRFSIRIMCGYMVVFYLGYCSWLLFSFICDFDTAICVFTWIWFACFWCGWLTCPVSLLRDPFLLIFFSSFFEIL